MFVGYLRDNFESEILSLQKDDEFFELSLLSNTYKLFPQYCFAAYEKDNIVGVISAYEFQKHLYINVLKTISSKEDLIPRLLKLLLENASVNNIHILVEKEYVKYFEEFNFQEYSTFNRYIHSGEAVAFNFSNSIAKQVNGEDYENVSQRIDKQVFSFDRKNYLRKDCSFSSSLKLSTQTGFLHSYVVNKRFVKISPWLMQNEAYMDAEKLLRGVLYYRGLKKIFAYAPTSSYEIGNLYENYKFKKDKSFVFLYLGDKPSLKLENIYAI